MLGAIRFLSFALLAGCVGQVIRRNEGNDSSPSTSNCRDGTLIFQPLSGRGQLARVVEGATDSPMVHVGILSRQPEGCTVVEAIGPRVQETQLDDFVSRSQGDVWLKKIKGLSETDGSRFVEAARRFIGTPYDFEFRHDNQAIYCSELVSLSASQVGLDVFRGLDVPGSWLDVGDPEVEPYLKSLGYHGADDPRLSKIRLITPRELFHHNDLEDLRGNSFHQSIENTPSHAVYDTLPGSTPQEKFDYLRRAWGRLIALVKLEIDEKDGMKRFHFRIDLRGYDSPITSASLTLFGRFPEEEELAEAIFNEIKNRGSRRDI